jgi:hypothetical protein
MNVIFFPVKHEIDNEEKVKLQYLQDKLNSSHIEIEQGTRNFSKGERYLIKQRYHNGFRGYWKIYPGGKDLA